MIYKKKILFVCDDLWPIGREDLGYVQHLKKLYRRSTGNVLLVLTRFTRIAESVGNATRFEPLEARGEKARAILLKAVSINFSNNAEMNAYMDKLLNICAGIPLTLSIAGAGVKLELNRHTKSSSAIKHYCEKLERFVETSVDIELLQYPCLSHVVQASLSYCEQWRQGARKFFGALCVLQRQATIPIRCLSGMWGVCAQEGSDIAEKMEEASLLRLEPCGEGTNVRLHDLVLKLCQGMVQADDRRSWHEKLCDSYMASLSEVGAWWDVEDDGYIMGNLSRHLIESGRVCDVHGLVCDVRWLWRRRNMGGWIAWEMDYERLMNAVDSESRGGMQHVHWVLKRCWPRLGRNQFPFQVYGHLSKTERKEPSARRVLDSIAQYYPRPWLRPFDKCLGPRDARELSMWKFGAFDDMAICLAKEHIVIAVGKSIIVWSMSKNERLNTIGCGATSIAVSADGQQIVSGGFDGSVRRWDLNTGKSIGDPLRGHKKEVTCVAVSPDGKQIVSGSEDWTVRRWDLNTGVSIGEPLRGHNSFVTCLAVSADGLQIVSGSDDGTGRRWDAHTGESIGDPLLVHHGWALYLAVSADSKQIVSGYSDGTVRRWGAHTGVNIGEPLRNHYCEVTCVTVSADGKQIISGSEDGTVRQWDARTGESIGELLRCHESFVICVVVSADGKQIICGCLDGTVRRWDAHTGVSIGEPLRGHENSVPCVAVSANGKMIVSGSSDGSVRRWDAHTGESIGMPLRGHNSFVTCLAVSADGLQIVSGSKDDTVRRWSALTGESIGVIAHAENNDDIIS